MKRGLLLLTWVFGCNEISALIGKTSGESPAAETPATPTPVTPAAAANPGEPAPSGPPPAKSKPVGMPPAKAVKRDAGAPLPKLTPEQIKAFWAAIKPARKATHEKDYDAAIAGYSAALAIAPGHARALSGRGYARLLKGDLAGAGSDLNAALAATSDTKLEAAIHYNIGLLAEKNNDIEAARRAFARSNELRPTKAAAERLNETTVCVAEVDRKVVPPKRYPTWVALRAAYPLEDYPAPKDEKRARADVCGIYDCDTFPLLVDQLTNPIDKDAWSGQYAETIVLTTTADGLLTQPLGQADKMSACSDSYDIVIVAETPWLIVRGQGTTCEYVDVDCEDEEDCESMDMKNTRDDYIDFHVVDPKDLRRVLWVNSPTQIDNRDEPVVTVQVTGDIATVRGGKCDESVPLPRS